MSQLMYPHPKVQHFSAHRALHRLGQSKEDFDAFLADRDAWIESQNIPEPERSMIRSLDYTSLVAAGLHPILVLTVRRKMEIFGVS